jgi:hypothetical protein
MTPGTGSIGTGRNMSTSQYAMEEIEDPDDGAAGRVWALGGRHEAIRN